MSERDWVFPTLVGLVVAFLGVFAIGLWAGEADTYYGDPQTYANEQGYTDADQETSALSIPLTGARSYQEICSNPQSHTDADLCQQWRSANAARDTSRLAIWQLVLGIVGVGGLAVTVYYASRTFRLGVGTSRAQLRAYVQAELGAIQELTLSKVAAITKIRNVGETPAYRLTVVSEIFTCDKPPSAKDDSEFATYCAWGKRAVRSELTLGSKLDFGASKETVPVPGHVEFEGDYRSDLEQAMAGGNKSIAFIGIIIYDDAFGVTHHTYFCHVFSLKGGAWIGLYHPHGNHSD